MDSNAISKTASKQQFISYKDWKYSQMRSSSSLTEKDSNTAADSNLEWLPCSDKNVCQMPEKPTSDDKSDDKLQKPQASMNSKAFASQKQLKPPTVNRYYKTRLCSNYVQKNVWNNKGKWSYAHSKQELRKCGDPYPEEYLKHVEELRK